MQQFNINKIEAGFQWLRNEFDNSGEIQSVDVLIQRLDAINSCLAWAGEQMAVSKKLWNEEKLNAYHKLKTSSESQKKYYSPSLAKEYVNAQCHQAEYNYDMCERFTRALVHIAENLRTAVSALKQQMILEGYTSNVPA